MVFAPADPVQARQISRWHFELRRFEDGFRLRPVSEGVTEIDGETIASGREVAIRPGTRVRVAHTLTLSFVSPPRTFQETSEETSHAERGT